MHPHAFEAQAIEPACLDGAIKQEFEREPPVGRGGEHGRDRIATPA